MIYLALLVVILSIVYSGFFKTRSSVNVILSPIIWVGAFSLLWFIFPAIYFLNVDYEAPSLGKVAPGHKEALIFEFTIHFLVFYLSMFLTFLVLDNFFAVKNKHLSLQYSTNVRSVAFLFLLVGLLSALILSTSFQGGVRSGLVSDAKGKILYALTYAGTAGLLVFYSFSLVNKNLKTAIFWSAVFLGCLFLLGGRGRVIWPVAHMMILYSIIFKIKIKPLKAILIATILFVFLNLLDFFMSVYLQGVNEDIFVSLSNMFSIFETRNFDGFYNFTLIITGDLVEPSLANFFNGPRKVFLEAYFPTAVENNVGFPPTLLGEIWLTLGGAGLLFGGVLYGMFIFLMDTFRKNITNISTLSLYVFLTAWVFHVGIAYFESFTKISIAAVFFIALIALEKGKSYYVWKK